MAGPEPDRRLHANRPFSIPWTSDQSKGTFSRKDILSGKQKAAFGSGQSLGIIVEPDPHNAINLPQRWPNAGRLLRVPKCVILSSLPAWTLYWPGCYFYGPRDVIGQMFTSPFLFGNYYYFDQWNLGDTSQEITDETIYCNNEVNFDCGDLPLKAKIATDSPFWNNFDPPVPDEQKIIWTKGYALMKGGLPPSGTDGILANLFPPSVRFSRIVGQVLTNPYYSLHQQLLSSFLTVKKRLESDPVDPIYVTIPGWMTALYQIRNGYLTKTDEAFSQAHGTGCTVVDANPCYNQWPIPWGPFYPNGKDDRNAADFPLCNVPYLATTDPGFGTNTLHIYVGHACHRYDSSTSLFGWQSWPLQPEGQFIGPTLISNYIGAALPYYAGRRAVWRDAGYDYGFMNHGAKGVYKTYASLIGAAATSYKKNFYKYRQFATRLFTYPQSISVDWQFDAIWQDQKHDCHSTAFYFGFDFADFIRAHSSEDQWYNDCIDDPSNPAHLKFAESIGNFPDSPSLRAATGTFYPPIRRRVDSYYGGIESGTADFYKLVIANQGLADFNVSYGGGFGSLLDPDALESYIRSYFKENP